MVEEDIEFPASINIVVRKRTHQIPYVPGDTVLEAARREELRLPFSCQIGSCATCMARLVEGRVHMKANNVLSEDELEEGFVLVCQSIPISPQVTIEYD